MYITDTVTDIYIHVHVLTLILRPHQSTDSAGNCSAYIQNERSRKMSEPCKQVNDVIRKWSTIYIEINGPLQVL